VQAGNRKPVGRDAELKALVGHLDLPDDLPRVAILAGEAGIGKTTLWVATCEAAAQRGYEVLATRPAETEARFSFVGLADLVGDRIAQTLPELPGPQRRALESALLLADHDDESANEHAVAAGFLNALRALSARQSLVLAVDDVQWLDAPSLAVVRFALARLRNEPIIGLLASRGRPPDWLVRALPAERMETIEVGPLTVGALHELLGARLGRAFARPSLVRLWETSGGNPFFALELGRALERRGGALDPGDELPIPDNLDDLVDERLGMLGASAQEATRAVALLAEPTDGLVEAAVGRSATEGLREAIAARVLDVAGERLRFSHPILASATVARMPSEHRRALHARLAAIVTDEEERARHLALAASGPDSTVADTLEVAAQRALSRGAPTAAAELAEYALRLTPTADKRIVRRRTVHAADRVYEAGDSARAIALLERILPSAEPGTERAEILRRLAAAHSSATGPEIGVTLYREALAECTGDDAVEAEIQLAIADMLRFTTGMAEAEPHAEAAVRAAERAGDEAILCSALAVFGLIQFKLGRGIPHEIMARAISLEEAVELPPGMWSLRPKAVLCDQLFWSHDLDAAQALTNELLEGAREREDVRVETELLWYLAMIEWRAGNWDHAAELADLTRAQGEQVSEGIPPVTEWPRALIAAHRGLVDEARAWAEDALARAESARVGTAEAGHLWVIGFIELSLGRPEEALSWLRRASKRRQAVGHGEPGQHWELPDLLDTLIALGELEEAEAAATPWEDSARRLDRAWGLAIAMRSRALILAARGDRVGALNLFERSLVEHERTQDPFQRARTLLALGITQRRARHRLAARKTLAQAARIFDDLGAPLWVEQARMELGRIGGRASAGDKLTASERRVAALVAEGRTNREVAAALFVGERTVETHLTHIYAKLGVRSRTELASRLH
jgi:DNA-binding CsgD family transcriptional regulator